VITETPVRIWLKKGILSSIAKNAKI